MVATLVAEKEKDFIPCRDLMADHKQGSCYVDTVAILKGALGMHKRNSCT